MNRYYTDPSERQHQKAGYQAYDVIDRDATPKPCALATGIRKTDAELIVAGLNARH